MTAPLALLLALFGLALNLAWANLITQPDWSAAILFAAMLAHRGNWTWAIPALWIHDLVLHWSMLVCLPIAIIFPFLLAYSDDRLGPGRPQRLLLMFLASVPLLWAGWTIIAWLMTLLLSLCCWHLFAKVYAVPVR